MLKVRQKVGKYKIVSRIADGPQADVYAAYDTIHKQRVCLKIPKEGEHVGSEDFLHEVQVAAKLRHPNILSLINASYIDDRFVIAMELGERSLADRMERRMSTARAMDLAGQALAGLAHAHEHKIIHCDIKPENFILFPGNQLKLADFGFAKLSLRTLKASGSGTIDYISPEQAMGRPKFQSDVFSLGLVLYRMFSGKLPEWPFKWPLPGLDRLNKRGRPELADLLRKAIQLDPAKRYRTAIHMRSDFERLKSHARRQKRVKAKNGVRNQELQSEPSSRARWAPPSEVPTSMRGSSCASATAPRHSSVSQRQRYSVSRSSPSARSSMKSAGATPAFSASTAMHSPSYFLCRSYFTLSTKTVVQIGGGVVVPFSGSRL